EYRYEMKKCMGTARCGVERLKMENYRSSIMNELKRVASAYPSVRIIDPLPFVCDQNWCPQVLNTLSGKIPAVFDDDHPSVAMTLLLGSKFASEFDWLISD